MLCVVTKYFDRGETLEIIAELEKYKDIIYWYGENRIESVIWKKLPRDQVHFIGNIQSRKIDEIVGHCSVIHSVWSMKHLQKISKSAGNSKLKTQVFLQYLLDTEKNIWFTEQELVDCLSCCEANNYLEIVWISWMGKKDWGDEERDEEFKELVRIRNIHLPAWKISAGTSRDYKIALKNDIAVVRIGKGLFL
jgi:uncharacterized pyridoxal phosphate-containing UPF0001 family protein